MNPKIMVISLVGATQRRNKISEQLQARGLDFSFMDAVEGRAGHRLFTLYDEAERLKVEAAVMSPGQLGCYASHYLAWELCRDLGQNCIILEDDALLLDDRLDRFICVVETLPAQLECVRLFSPLSDKNKPWKMAFNNGGITVYKYKKGHKSTTGYYLTPSGAEKFLKASNVWTQPVDIEMDRFWKNKVECYGVHPPCLTNDNNFESMIGYEKVRPARSISVTLHRKAAMFADSILRSIHNMKYAIRHR